MQKTIEKIAGDTDGMSFEFAVYRIKGRSSGAPSAYLQAALHGDELPGVVAIDALMAKLRVAEAEGRVLGDVTIVPSANPIGRAQYHVRRPAGPLPSGNAHQFQPRLPADRQAGCDAAAACRCALQGRPAAQGAAGRTVDGARHRARPALRRRGRALSLRAGRAVARHGRLRRGAWRRGGADLARPFRCRLRGGGDPSLSCVRRRPERSRRDHRRVARHRRRRARLRARRMPRVSTACWLRAASSPTLR